MCYLLKLAAASEAVVFVHFHPITSGGGEAGSLSVGRLTEDRWSPHLLMDQAREHTHNLYGIVSLEIGQYSLAVCETHIHTHTHTHTSTNTHTSHGHLT